uniref:Probable magnesium transporter n=1 Tax=Ananas comosus var. bracteatus TaxID=296719 RepID=A0A6V7P1C3_ANACO|nr:unnamed protein product [Ananas comosus var. bracteatus]
MVMSKDNLRGFALALSSSFFIGSSFVIKKIGLRKAALFGRLLILNRALWWLGMITMIVGEIANFAAYAFAPAILVTPLGALSIIVSAVLAHFILGEKLHIFGILGCVLCVVGSTTIVLHAPKERNIESVKEVWHLATEPGFLIYSCVAAVLVLVLIIRFVPRYGQKHMVIYIGICSLMGSLTVMSVKAVGIALKLSFSGMNQFIYVQTWFFSAVVIICCLVQLNYLNKALDTFNTAVVSPVYFVMFTILTIFASMIMFKEWDSQNATQIVTELCGFVTILSGTFLLHKTKDMGNDSPNTETAVLTESELQNQ